MVKYTVLEMVGKLFLSSHFAIEKGTIFENKLFILSFEKKYKISVKISVYKLASVCYSFFRLKREKVIIKLIYFFFQLQDYTADGNTRKINALVLFCKLLL